MQPEKPCFAAGLADNDDDTPGQTGSPGHTPESSVARGQWRKKPGISFYRQMKTRPAVDRNKSWTERSKIMLVELGTLMELWIWN